MIRAQRLNFTTTQTFVLEHFTNIQPLCSGYTTTSLSLGCSSIRMASSVYLWSFLTVCVLSNSYTVPVLCIVKSLLFSVLLWVVLSPDASLLFGHNFLPTKFEKGAVSAAPNSNAG